MKRVVSVSLGSSTRDKRVETEILGEPFIIERIGTDGDMAKFRTLVEQLDGRVAAIGAAAAAAASTSGSAARMASVAGLVRPSSAHRGPVMIRPFTRTSHPYGSQAATVRETIDSSIPVRRAIS